MFGKEGNSSVMFMCGDSSKRGVQLAQGLITRRAARNRCSSTGQGSGKVAYQPLYQPLRISRRVSTVAHQPLRVDRSRRINRPTILHNINRPIILQKEFFRQAGATISTGWVAKNQNMKNACIVVTWTWRYFTETSEHRIGPTPTEGDEQRENNNRPGIAY